ncbi:anti-repressor SinI family protein [Virgibacillus necropolis]|uniref:Sin domain-containing protein n=1 Tax=Virgibacillus necropolis TaxID=163877 RepID=A0A221MAM1_9BACI|nr:anti-repressor SinI family protein [Virgibacillus necropolis]ASN04708.1 hypothetical protein CFK40_06620 [Virgibacillus necropolis]
MIKIVKQVGLDNEWVELLQEAKSLGITIEEVRLFLNEVNNGEKINQ